MSYQFEFSYSATRAEHIMLSIARSNALLLPKCMRLRHYDCTDCPVANPDTCLLTRDEDFASYLRYRVSEDFRLRDLIRAVIKEHGRPMYWDIIASMVRARHPQISEHTVYMLLSSYKSEFVKFDVGVYGLAEWESKRVHTSGSFD